jgi:hypothetical protein
LGLGLVLGFFFGFLGLDLGYLRSKLKYQLF